MNVDCPREQYSIHGQRITRSDARGTRNFTIHWDQGRQRWQWGTHGRLSLQWLGEDAIAWVPEAAWDVNHARVWRWQRCVNPLPHAVGAEPAAVVPDSYRPWRRSRSSGPTSQFTQDSPYARRPWRGSERSHEAMEDRPSNGGHFGYHGNMGGSHHYRQPNQAFHCGGSHAFRRTHSTVGAPQQANMLPCGLTPAEVYSLLSRDIMPEDYELLLRLDEAVPKPTATAESLKCLTPVDLHGCRGGKCPVCLSLFEEHDSVVALPCGHQFHHSCITTWLAGYRRTCPLCCSETLPA